MSSMNGDQIPLVYMENITQRFGLIEALCKVNFVVRQREIVGLLGDNGAGKSTLIKVLTGIHTPTEGQIYFEGRPVTIDSPKTARAMGIETVYQDLALVNLMSISRNFYLGREPHRYVGPVPFMDKQTMSLNTVEALDKIGIEIRRPEEEVLRLSGGERQSIAIGRAVHFGSKLLILDEPTSALSVGETRKVLDYTRQAKEHGLSVIFITHNIGHVYQVADRFTIISHGHKVGDFFKDEVSQQEIAEMIMGGPVPERLRPQQEQRAVEIQEIGKKMAAEAAPSQEAARQANVRTRNLALGLVAAVIVILLLLAGAGVFNPPPPTPTPTPTPMVEVELTEEVQALITQLLQDTDPSRRAIAASYLGRQPYPQVIEALTQALSQDGDPSVRERAAVALGRIGSTLGVGTLGRSAYEALVASLRDNYSTVRNAAGDALQQAYGVSCSDANGCPTAVP